MKNGLFEWLVMPLGLTNAPRTFIRLMNEVLKPFLRDFVVLYLNDILIFNKIKGEHLEHVRQVLQWLKEEKLLKNLNKWTFPPNELVYLGFFISKEGLKIDPRKVKDILEWTTPESTLEVWSFHALTSFMGNSFEILVRFMHPSLSAWISGLSNGQQQQWMNL